MFARVSFALMLLFDLSGAARPAAAQSRSIDGRILDFACGDNCYLTLVDRAGRSHVGLCTAHVCRPWNEKAAMPEGFKNRHVVVSVAQGTQIDAAGNVMGSMMAFSRVKFVD